MGKASTAMPSSRTAWERMVSHRRFSTMPRCSLVVDLALDEAELDDGEADDADHEDDGLRGRAAEILADEAVGVALVDEVLGRFPGAAISSDVRRVGKECVGTGRSRWEECTYKTKEKTNKKTQN